MNTFSSAFLGVLQGITEFLPVSSSGHLVLGQYFLGIKEPQVFFDVALHVATLMVVLYFFRHDIANAVLEVMDALRQFPSQKEKIFNSEILKVAISTIPIAVAGLLGRDFIERMFADPRFVAYNMITTGCILIVTRFRSGGSARNNEVSWMQAIAIGVAQIFALAPGISRSGITISSALLLGCSREAAARFSFFLFIPAVVGAFILEFVKLDVGGIYWGVVISGFFAALISGYIALKWLIRLVKRGVFYRFAFYCWAIGILTLFFVKH